MPTRASRPTKNAKLPNQAQRKVGLDRPCSACGQPIYFNYKGPIDGVCGRCTDRQLARRRRTGRTRTVFVRAGGGGLKPGVVFLLGLVVGAALMFFVYPFLF